MEAPISPNKRSHSTFDLFVEAAGKRFEDESFGGVYSNSVSSQSENEPPDFQTDFNKRSKFNTTYAGMTSEEITQTYHLSQNSMDDFYIAETPICSSQNSQISTNTLTIDTNFDDGHNDAKQDSDKSGMSTKLVDGIASSSSGVGRNKNGGIKLVPSSGSIDSIRGDCSSVKNGGIVSMIADISENPLLEKYESFKIPDQQSGNLCSNVDSIRNQSYCKADTKSQEIPLSPGLDAIWAAVKIVMPPAYDIDEADDITFDEALANASKVAYKNHDQLIADVKESKGPRRIKSRPPKGSTNGLSAARTSPVKARSEKASAAGEGGVKQGNVSRPEVLSCNCRKTRCLKMYCDCFRFKKYCHKHCNCSECANLPEYESERLAVMAAILERNPDAFKPKVTKAMENGGAGDGQEHLTGCHCKRSACLKKYCECYTAQVACSDRCRCIGCRNTVDARSGIKFVPSTITMAYMRDSAEVDSKLREAVLMKKTKGGGASNVSSSCSGSNSISNSSSSNGLSASGKGSDDDESKSSLTSESEPKLLLHPQLPNDLLKKPEEQEELTPSISKAMNEMDMTYGQEDRSNE